MASHYFKFSHHQMELKTSSLTNVDGSAELVEGKNKVIVSVSGPIEPKAKQELPNVASLEIITRPSIGVSTTRENLINDKLRSILSGLIIRHKYPRQLIQIVVQVLITECDSIVLNDHQNTIDNLKFFNGELSTIINCCYFALLDANIGLFESFVSINQTISSSGVIEVSPNLQALIDSTSTHIVVLSIKDGKPNKIMYIDSKGNFTQPELFKVIDHSYSEGEKKFAVFKDLVTRKLTDDFKWKS